VVSGPRFHLPWRVERMPRALPGVLAVLMFASAAAKVMKPNYLCGPDRWEAANGVMFVVEFLLALGLAARPARRRFAALSGALVFLGAAALLTYLEVVFLLGNRTVASVRDCGCFGPIEMPYAGHMAVIAVLVAGFAWVFLVEETRARTPTSPAASPAPQES